MVNELIFVSSIRGSLPQTPPPYPTWRSQRMNVEPVIDCPCPARLWACRGGEGTSTCHAPGVDFDHEQRIQTRGLFPGPGIMTPYRTCADSPTLSRADFMLTAHHFQCLQQHRARIIRSAPILAPKVPSFQQAKRDMTRKTYSQ
jgi:hypothetical protein